MVMANTNTDFTIHQSYGVQLMILCLTLVIISKTQGQRVHGMLSGAEYLNTTPPLKVNKMLQF